MSKLDELAEAVKMRLCHRAIIGDSATTIVCEVCEKPITKAARQIPNTDDPVFKALWLRCPGDKAEEASRTRKETFYQLSIEETYAMGLHKREPCALGCDGKHLRRPLDNSVRLLPGAITEMGLHWQVLMHNLRQPVKVVVWDENEWPHPHEDEIWYEALSAAVLDVLDRMSHEH